MSTPLLITAVGLILLLMYAATVTNTLRRMSQVRLSELLQRAGRAQLVERVTESHGDFVICAAILRTTCTVALVLALLRMCETAGVAEDWRRYLITFAGTLSLVAVFGVAIPAAWSRYAGESLLRATLPALIVLWRLFSPIAPVLRLVDAPIRRLAGVSSKDGGDDAARHERELLDAVSEGEKLGAVDEEEKEMIESVIDLRDSTVAEIMTPRTEIEAVDKDVSFPGIRDHICRIGHSRIPVYEETIDHVLGIIYAKDLLSLEDGQPFRASNLMRPARFIPETKNIRDLLHEFQAKKVHMAIVLDEYGGTAGLVTIEDILEELVGEIEDEYDTDEQAPLTRIDDDTVDIDARMRVDELNDELQINLPEDDDYETIGGFVFSLLGRIPVVGELCAHEDVDIQIIDAEPRRINRLRLHVKRGTADPPADDGQGET